MSQITDHSKSIADHLSQPIEVGDADVSGPLAVFPLFGPEPRLAYTSFASAQGNVRIGELKGGASVNDLLVENVGDLPVLLYEGEEVIGAQQNRILDIPVLVDARSKVNIPVSCVEQGRWDGRRRRESFRASAQTADPRMRRLKHRRVSENVRAQVGARADQREVWDEVASRQMELQSPSPTGAMHDTFEANRERLGQIREGIRLRERQCGSVAVIAGKIAILDFVSRPDVFASLHSAIVEGYALDALGSDRAGEPESDVDPGTVHGFTLLATDARSTSRTEGPGKGSILRFGTNVVEGSALVADDELVQLTAFPTDADSDNDAPLASRSRINRPSRRRHT